VTSPAIVPLPASTRPGGGAPFPLTPQTWIDADAASARAATDLQRLVTVRTGIVLGAATAEGTGATSPVIRLQVDPAADLAAEGYRLTVRADGVALVAADPAGAFYGVQTLGQLISAAAAGAEATARELELELDAVTIDDAPRFAYRGVMLDVARHFHPVETVEAYIARAATLKFNVLHLHLSDDQGWRLELRSRPELTARASATAAGGDPGGFYTQDDWRRLLATAAAHSMTVVPEFDMPGHTHAVSLAYPEVVAEPVITDGLRSEARDRGESLPVHGEPYEGIAVGFSSLRIGEPATDAFVADVFGELAALTPGPYLHLGGDEALGTPADAFANFVAGASAVIAAAGKTPIAWHEAGAAAGLHPGTVGQYWGFVRPTDGMDDRARAFVAGGGSVILSPANAVYLDMKPADDEPLGLTWAGGATSVRRSYEWEPAAVIDGVGDEHILGVEAPLWTETVRTLDDIDTLAFPRLAAAAEAAWSVQPYGDGERTWTSFQRRAGAQRPLWASLGIRFRDDGQLDEPAAASESARSA
jgi:hexosaminidase